LLCGSEGIGPFAGRVRTFDATETVGRHHALAEYLTAPGPLGGVLRIVAEFPDSIEHDPLFPPPAPVVARRP